MPVTFGSPGLSPAFGVAAPPRAGGAYSPLRQVEVTDQFRKRELEKTEQPLGGMFDMRRWKGGGKKFFNTLRSPKWWMQQGLTAGGITLATCWLPGSQLITIPVWLSISAALKFAEGFQNPAAAEKQKNKNEQKDADNQSWRFSQKAHASMLGAWQGVRDTFKNHWKRHVGVAGMITLATCWLPGSQLVIIPAYLAMVGASDALRGAFKGFKKPGNFLSSD